MTSSVRLVFLRDGAGIEDPLRAVLADEAAPIQETEAQCVP